MKFTIQKLRQAGFKVRVLHARHYGTVSTKNAIRMSGYEKRLSGKGGDTRIEITTPDKQTTVVGIARCSLQDSFDRKLGNQIALGRALTEFEENHPQVKELLNTL
jgi:hypothetical protein